MLHCWLAINYNRCPRRPDGRDLVIRLANIHLEECRNTSTYGGNDLFHASWHPLQNRFAAEDRKLTDFYLQTSLTVVPTDPMGVICVSDVPKRTWGGAGTPPHPGATILFILLDIHYKTRLRPKCRKLTNQWLQTIITITPTDPIDVICVSDLPNWTWKSAGTPPHPGATTWFILLDTHLQNPFTVDFAWILLPIISYMMSKNILFTQYINI